MPPPAPPPILASAPARLLGMASCLVAGTAAGWPHWAWAGALGGYLLAHSAGWALDRLRATPQPPSPPPTGARRYRLRTATLPGSMAAGLGFGLLGVIMLAGTFGLLNTTVVRRMASGAPLLYVIVLLVAVTIGVLWLRRVVLSDVEVILGEATLVLRTRYRADAWRELKLPLADIVTVTRFVDPFGGGRWLRVDAGDSGRFELRASGLTAGRPAQAAITRLGVDLIDRLGARTSRRPYLARWGTSRHQER